MWCLIFINSNFWAQSFPVQLEGKVGNFSLSTLTNTRSYLRSGRGGDTNHSNIDSSSYSYTLSDLRGLVEYASERGITVVPELDMPAHTL